MEILYTGPRSRKATELGEFDLNTLLARDREGRLWLCYTGMAPDAPGGMTPLPKGNQHPARLAKALWAFEALARLPTTGTLQLCLKVAGVIPITQDERVEARGILMSHICAEELGCLLSDNHRQRAVADELIGVFRRLGIGMDTDDLHRTGTRGALTELASRRQQMWRKHVSKMRQVGA